MASFLHALRAHRIFALFVFVLGLGGAATSALAQTFVHPGGLHTQADLDRMKTHVLAGDHPWIDSWNALIADSRATATYNPAPQANIGVNRQRASADAVAAYLEAIRGYISGDTTYTDNAIRICNLWSAAVNQVPTGTDQPGLNGLYTYQFAVVGEILRIHVGTRWAQSDFQRFQAMLSTYLYPACHDFLVRHNGACVTHYWANWDCANITAIAAIGVLCDDQSMFNEAVDYFKNGGGAGSIMNAVAFRYPGNADEPYGLGQWQETGRDQEHNNLGVGLLATFCEIAWNQGIDLFSYDNNRLLAGAEYVAQYALWQDVPYTTYNNCDNVNQYWASRSQRGRLQRPIWELIYNHYVVRRGLTAPNVAAIAALNRPEAYTHDDHFGYGSLAFTLDANASPLPSITPATPQNLVASAGVGRIYLSWPAVSGANGYTVKRATAAAGPYSVLSTYRGTNAEYYDTSVNNGTTYYYTVVALNQVGASADSSAANATPQATTTALPSGWARRDVGVVTNAGSATYSAVAGNSFNLSGSGAGIGSIADGCSFLFAEVSGDTTLTARLIDWNLSGVGGSGKLGLMIRESLAPDAKTAVLVIGDVGFREARFGARAANSSAMTFMLGNAYSATLPTWFRLQRVGNTITAFQSDDGINWFTVGSTTVSINSISLVGLTVAPASVSTNSALFDNVTLTGTVMPSQPTGLTTVNGNNQVSLFWNASDGAAGYDVKRASASGGPYAVIASGVTSASYVDTGLAQGVNYYYVVSARQGTYESVESEEVIGTPGDIRLTWSSTPTSGAWSLGTNWIGGNPPSAGSSLSFGNTSIATLNNDFSSLAVGDISFSANAPAYTIGGNALSLSGTIANNAPTTQTFALPLQLTGSAMVTTTSGPVAITGVISGPSPVNGLTKVGAQTLSLSGLNTFAGDFTLTSGTVSIAGTGTGAAGAPTAGALGRGAVKLNAGTLTSSAAATIYNTVVVPTGSTVSLSSATANLTLAGNLSGGGTINESGTNVGGTHFNGDNSGFTGTFTSSNATNHRIRFNASTAGSANATWVLNNSQTDGYGLTFGNGTISFGALSGSGVFRSDSANGTIGVISIGALNTDTTFTGTMVSNGTRYIGVTKVGTGKLTFTGANTYDGPTTVTAGTLLINGSIRSAVTVNGGTFGGNGSSTAAVTVNSGGALTPGGPANVGTFTTSAALTLSSGSTYQIELNSDTNTADKTVAAGVTLNGATLSITNLGSAALAAGAQLTIIDNTAATSVSGTFANLPEGTTFAAGANQFRISYVGGTGNDVVLTAIAPAMVELDALNQTYDGTARAVSVTTTPANLAVSVTYDGASIAPTNAGSYAVVATISQPNYAGSASGTLVVEKAAASVALSSLSATYDGSPKPVSATTTPSGLAVTTTYNGSVTPPIHAGDYTVLATVSDANFTGSASGTLSIAKANATIALSSLAQSYDGAPKSVTATTVPANLNVKLTYDGQETAPIYPGPHAVSATIDDLNYSGATTDSLVISATALVRHAPSLNGDLEGSLQLLNGESFSLNSSGSVSTDLLLPGNPVVQINGSPTFAGIKDGPGSLVPSNYTVTLNSGSVLRYAVRRIDALGMPTVSAPPAPTGTRDVTIGGTRSAVGDFTTLRNLTVNNSNGGGISLAVPPGTYGAFTLNGASTLVLGVANGSDPAIYNLQSLTVNSGASIQIIGPVILTLASGGSLNGSVNANGNATLFTLRIASGGLTLNNGVVVHGKVIAPNGTIAINSAATLVGEIVSDGLSLSGALIEP